MRLSGCLVAMACLVAASASAQDRRVAVRVEDPSGATIPAAHVIVFAGSDLLAEVNADGGGIATVPIGRATDLRLIVSAQGFETTELDVSIPVRVAAPAISVTLPIGTVEDSIVVSGTAEEPGAQSFALTPAEVDALPDDDESMLRYLEELAGPGADVRVDGFAGRPPSRDQILRIAVRRDAYSAEFPQPGQGRVDIITRPSADRWRTNAQVQFRPSALSAHNALAPDRASGTYRRIGGSLAAPIVRNKTGVFVEGNASTSEESRAIAALTPSGPFVTAVNQPSDDYRLNARLETMMTPQMLMRVSWSGERNTRANQGLSELDLPERGYERRSTEQSVRASLDGGTRLPFYMRLRWEGNVNEIRPDTIAPALIVNSAFRSGGATQAGRDRSDSVTFEGAATLVARPFTLRAGGDLTWNSDLQGQVRNTLGTFTFLDLDAYSLGTPAIYSRRFGAQALTIDTMQAALFAQADFSWRSGWSLGLGARYHRQTHLGDWRAISPRVGVSRSLKSGRTTFRAGYGWYYGWLPTSVWEETRRLGQDSAEQEIIVRNPGYPDPLGAGGQQVPDVDPATLVSIAAGADLTRWSRTSFGLTQQLRGGLRTSVDVYRIWSAGEWRAIDLNAPIGGLRPDPERGRTVLVNSIGRASESGFSADIGLFQQSRFAQARYSWSRRWNDGDAALTPPPDGRTLITEWAPSRSDRGHQLSWSVGWPLPWGLNASLFGRVGPGSRYTVTTGLDENGDALFTERPPGVGRNDRRGLVQTTSDFRLLWRPPLFGRVTEQRRGPGGRPGAGRPVPRPERSMEIYLSVNNLFNRVNYSSYVGVLSSPLFGLPTSALSARRVEVGWRLLF